MKRRATVSWGRFISKDGLFPNRENNFNSSEVVLKEVDGALAVAGGYAHDDGGFCYRDKA